MNQNIQHPLAWLTPQDDQVWINYLNHWINIKKAQGFFQKNDG